MSIDGGKTIQINRTIAHKYETDKPCPYCVKKGGIYESCEAIGGGRDLIGVHMSYTYHCIFCKHKWHSWKESKMFYESMMQLSNRVKEINEKNARKS